MFLPMIYSFSFVEIVINFFVLSDGYKTLLALPHRQSIASEWPGTARSYFIDSAVGEVYKSEKSTISKRVEQNYSQQDPIFDTGI